MTDQFIKRDLPWAIGLVVTSSLTTALVMRLFFPFEKEKQAVADQPQQVIGNSAAQVIPEQKAESSPQIKPEPKKWFPVVWHPDPDTLPPRQPHPFNGLQDRLAKNVQLPVPTIITWATSQTGTSQSGATNKRSPHVSSTVRLIALDECDPIHITKPVADFVLKDMLRLGHTEGKGSVGMTFLSPGGGRDRLSASIDFENGEIQYK